MKRIAIFLFSHSDTIAKPWAEAGIDCHMFDLKHGEDLAKNIRIIRERFIHMEEIFRRIEK